MDVVPEPPEVEYAARVHSHRTEAGRQALRYRALGRGRALTVGLIVALVILTEKEHTSPPKALALVPAALSVVLIVRWNRAALAHQRAARAAAYYDGRIACLEGRWAGRGDPGTRYLAPDHPAALDLDLFGVGSLFELLCTARTSLGQDTLASWLSSPAGSDEIRARQEAVSDLRPRSGLREDLVVLASEVPDGGRVAALVRFAGGNVAPLSRVERRAVYLSPLLTLAALVAAGLAGAPTVLVLACLAPQVAVALWLRRFAERALEPVLSARPVLRPLAAVLARVEREQFSSRVLRGQDEALRAAGRRASRLLVGLSRLLALEFPATLLACRPQLALTADTWRRSRGQALHRWLNSLSRTEALCALATHARENPSDPFPEIVSSGPLFAAEGLGHPFLARQACVPNDLSLGDGLRLLVVSGSNMSGKSTLLRAVGVNAALALAGAPVRAARLRLSPLTLGSNLRVQDSLGNGRSRFYAEALRVRRLLDLAAGPAPLMFLLDELFQGTNSRDRRLGAEAVLRRLVDAGAIGLVTTHDLALTEIVGLLGPRAANVHFADKLAEGALAFDYRLRPGVVPASNGLAVLRAVGIDV